MRYISIDLETISDGRAHGNDMAELIRSLGSEFTHVVVTDGDGARVFTVAALAHRLDQS